MDVLDNTGGMFSIIRTVIVAIISFITFGITVPKCFKKSSTCVCCNYNDGCCCCNYEYDRCIEIIFGGIAPYQKYNKTDEAKLLRVLKENNYCSKDDYQLEIQQLKQTIQQLQQQLQDKHEQ